MKIEIEPYKPIPEGWEAVEMKRIEPKDIFLGMDGSVYGYETKRHSDVIKYIPGCHSTIAHGQIRLIVRRKLYAPIPEGYVEDGWIEANTREPLGTPFLHPSLGVRFASGEYTVSSRPLLRLKKKTRTATVLTARVVLPEGYSGVDPSGDSVRIWGGTRFPFTWTETTEEVPA